MAPSLVGYEVGEAADPDGSGDERDRAAIGPTGEPVTLRRFDARGAAGPPVPALLRAAGAHVETVLDVGTAPNGDPVLVLTHLPHRLTDLMTTRRLSPGEVVTLLVPLVQTVDRIHALGVAHGALGPAAVRFDAAGTPVLTGFDDAVLALGPRDARFEAVVSADDQALRTLASALIGRAGQDAWAVGLGRGPVGARGVLAGALADPAVGPVAIVQALFDWADPEPVLLLDELPPLRPPVTPGRIIDAAQEQPHDSADDPAAAGRASVRAPIGPVFRAAERETVRDSAGIARRSGAVRRVIGRAAGQARGVRPGVWVAAGAALVLLTAAIVLLPGRGAQAEGAPSPTATATKDGSAARAPSAARPSRRASMVAASTDAAAAAAALLSIRDSCLAARDEGCLRTVEDVGSPVAVVDAEALAARQPPVRVPHGIPVVRDTSGATATVDIGPVTALLIRQRDRWLIRDVVVPPG